ncbi:MAG: hypothetical protein COV99_04665 [Bacteroidetes bacterium CG12_big_fil_rev_8_21_14_0_65_60_17]|nr:MAG: hypothetical protein COV99_04665 [Bacteroidetes bacterium CG12_big_fil_rev_8_21_14_0_65_60_17]
MRLLPAAILSLLLMSATAWAEGTSVGTTGVASQAASTKLVRAGIYQNKPKLFMDAEGTPSGLFVDVLEAIAERADWQVEWVECTWSECLEALRRGDLDLMPDMAWSRERDAWMDFHAEEVLESWSQVFTARGADIASWSDLDGKRLAVLRGSIQEASIGSLIRGFGYDTELVLADSWEDAFDMVRSGHADAAAPNHFFGNYFYREYGLKRSAIVVESQALYFAAAASANPLLLRAIDEHLAALKSEPGSAYYASLTRWLERPAPRGFPSYLLWALVIAGGLLLLSGSAIFVLRSRVRVRTRHLAEANRSLAASEEKFRSLFENTSVVKLLVRPDSGQILEANQAAVSFYGWTHTELLSMTYQDLLGSSTAPFEFEDLLRSGSRRFEQQHCAANGSGRDVDVFAATVRIRDEVCIHLIAYDITEYRSMQEQLRHAQKMEAVGRLAGGVAHDFNNFLGVIIGHTELALHSLGSIRAEDASLRNHLDEILVAANKSKAVSQQLTAFARKSVTRPVLFDVNVRVEGMLRTLQRMVGEDISVEWSPAEDPCTVRMDPSLLDQVLANLCVNARDAIEDTGTVSISTRCTDTDVHLSVQDDGCGMDQETVVNVFEPFFSTKGVGHATGLGLATAHGIVEQAGGRIEVRSAPDAGTLFRVVLPHEIASPDVRDGEQADHIPGEHHEGATILLVDDEPAIVEMTKLALETLGHRVLAVHSPGEALECMEEHGAEVCLVMTDVVMPEMNGRELARRLKARWPSVEILYMSGYTNRTVEEKGVPSDDVQLIQKPFSMADLSEAIKKTLQNGS